MFRGIPGTSFFDHQFLLRSPYPGVPEENFGIRWKGYIQPYKSGLYKFTVFFDDAVFIEIDGNVVIQHWEPGVHTETGSLYLEAGRLYPIHIRYYEYLYGAQIRLRWSSADFPEEVIPTSQLYPEGFLPETDESEWITIENITDNQLSLRIESDEEVELNFSVISVNGTTIDFPPTWITFGKNDVSLDISKLPSGFYYLHGVNTANSKKGITPFVKIN